MQAGSIPVVLEGRDLLAAAQTGTGKTAAFLLPTMNNLEHIAPPKPVRERGGRNRRRGAKKPEGNGRGPVMLVITPTRELAQQIDEVASKIADVTGHVAVTRRGWRELQAADRLPSSTAATSWSQRRAVWST